MYTNGNALFMEFLDPKTKQFDVQKITNLIVKAKTYDKAMAFAVDQARASGGLEVVKGIKNTDFTPDGKKAPITASPEQLQAQAIAAAIAKNGR